MTYTLNIVDLALTLHALRHGGVELNPLMQCAPVMIFYKVVAVGVLLRWLEQREDKLARYGLRFCTAVYATVVLWHIVNLLVIWR